MTDKKQKIRFNDGELSLMKALFADDAEFGYVLRRVLLQFPLNDNEKELLKGAWNDKVSSLVRKLFLPELERDAPLFQLTNLALSLGSDIKGLSPEGAFPFVKTKKLEVDYLNQQLDNVQSISEGKKVSEKIKLSDLSKLDYEDRDDEKAWVNLTAWNWLLSFIDSNIAQAKILAGMKTETVEETKARLERDSAK